MICRTSSNETFKNTSPFQSFERFFLLYFPLHCKKHYDLFIFLLFLKKHELIFQKKMTPAEIQFKYNIRNLGFEHIHLLLLAILV